MVREVASVTTTNWLEDPMRVMRDMVTGMMMTIMTVLTVMVDVDVDVDEEKEGGNQLLHMLKAERAEKSQRWLLRAQV